MRGKIWKRGKGWKEKKRGGVMGGRVKKKNEKTEKVAKEKKEGKGEGK